MEPTSLEVIQTAVATPSPRVEATPPRMLPDKIFQGDKPFDNNTPKVNSSDKKVYDPKKLTLLIQQHDGLRTQRKHNHS